MAAHIEAWLGDLIASELSDILSWQSDVKPEPGVPRVQNVGRFEDDGSNYRATITPPNIGPASKLQLLKAPNAETKAAIPVSDGQTQIKARLSSDAWASYAEALEGEDPMKGDIVTCRKLTLISTPFGPPDDQVQLQIAELDFEGVNARKTIGQPKQILLQTGMQDLIAKTARLRMQQYEDGWPDVLNATSVEGNEEPEALSAGEQDQNRPMVDADPEAPLSSPIQSQHPGSNLSSPNASLPLETQVPLDSGQRTGKNAMRRGRGGHLSMATHGVEAASGVNLSQPQAPHLPVTKERRSGVSAKNPPRNEHLLSIIKGKQAKTGPEASSAQQAPERPVEAHHVTAASPKADPILGHSPIVPKSAQVAPSVPTVETSSETAKVAPDDGTALTTAATFATPQTRTRRKPHRIPANQLKLLSKKDCWVPSLPGQQLPHPNVPIALLEAWNARAKSPAEDAPMPTPAVPIEVSSSDEESDHAGKSSVAGAPVEEASDSESSISASDDEPFEWSQSPSQKTRLPPDSSAQGSSGRKMVEVGSTNPDSSHSEVIQPNTQKRPRQTSDAGGEPVPKRPAPPSTPVRFSAQSLGQPTSDQSKSSSRISPASIARRQSVSGTQAPRSPLPSAVLCAAPVVDKSPSMGSAPRTPSGNVPPKATPQRVPETIRVPGPDESINSSASSLATSRISAKAHAPPTFNGSAGGLRLSGLPNKPPQSVSSPQQQSSSQPNDKVPQAPTGSVSGISANVPTGPRYPNVRFRRPLNAPTSGPIHSSKEQNSSQVRTPHPLPAKPPSSAGDLRPLYNGKSPRTIPWSSQPEPARMPFESHFPCGMRPGQAPQQGASTPARWSISTQRMPSGPGPNSSADTDRPPPLAYPRPSPRDTAGTEKRPVSSSVRRGDPWRSDPRENDFGQGRGQQQSTSAHPDSSGELQMAPPRPLRAYEDEDFRARRSEFYRGQMRRGWLAVHLTQQEAQKYELRPLLEAYRKASPKDPAPAEEFRQAILELYPDAGELNSAHGTKAMESEEVGQQEKADLAGASAWRKCRYGEETANAFPPGSTPEDARAAYRKRAAELETLANTQAQTQTQTQAQVQSNSPVNLFAANAASVRETGKAPVQPPVSADRAVNSDGHLQKPVSVHTEVRRGSQAPSQHASKRLEDGEDDISRHDGRDGSPMRELPPSIFSEFAQAWSKTSAFASRGGDARRRAPQRRTVNVLGWSLGD